MAYIDLKNKRKKTASRAYQNSQSQIPAGGPPLPPPSLTSTPSVTPSVTKTPSVTPTITRTPSITPSVTRTPSVTPSSAYFYLANKYGCTLVNGTPSCGQFIEQVYIYNPSTDFIIGQYYAGDPLVGNIYVFQPISRQSTSLFPNGPIGNSIYSLTNTTAFNSCASACNGGIYISVTPSVTKTPSVTPTVTPSISITPSVTPTSTISITPSITPSPSV